MTKADLKVEQMAVDRLLPYARNARTHSDAQVAQIAASITEFGWTNPLLVDENGGIIAGHGRLLAARKLGMAKVPVIVRGGLTETQKRALVLADNKLALNAGWDEAMLANELAALIEDGYDVGMTGFDPDEIDRLIASAEATATGATDAEETPEAPAEPVSVPGDVWVMGRHRIICGDATAADVVAKLLGDVKPHLMVTDPPYGVEYDANWRNEVDRKNGKPYGASAVGKVKNDDKADWREAWALFPGEVAYVWHAGVYSHVVATSLESTDFQMRALIVWAKSQLVISRGHYHHMHEPCWYAVRKSGTGHWTGDRKQTTLWQIDKPQKSETGHSTQKPVECMRRPIENNSSPGQAVYEPFSGSGTTIIACKQTGRACHAVELNPAYVDVAVERWQKFTGKEATHAETGETFAAMTKARGRKAA